MAVTLSLFAGAGAQFFDNNGVMLSGGLVYTYGAGTTTPLAAYTSNTGATALSNPIVLDASGRVPTGEIWLTYGQGYKFTVKTSTGTLIGTYDNIPSAALPPLVNDAVSIAYEQGASVTAGNFIIGQTYLITFIGSTNFQSIGAVSNTVGIYFTATGVGSGTGTAEFSRTVQAKLRESVSVADFGAIGDGIADDTAAIQAAIDTGLIVNFVNDKIYKTTAPLTGASVFIRGNRSTIKMYGDVDAFNVSAYCHFYDLTIQNQGSPLTATNSAIQGAIYGSTFENVYVSYFNIGFDFTTNSYLLALYKCTAYNCITGFKNYSSSTAATTTVFDSCYALACGTGFYLYGISDGEMRNCAVDIGNGDYSVPNTTAVYGQYLGNFLFTETHIEGTPNSTYFYCFDLALISGANNIIGTNFDIYENSITTTLFRMSGYSLPYSNVNITGCRQVPKSIMPTIVRYSMRTDLAGYKLYVNSTGNAFIDTNCTIRIGNEGSGNVGESEIIENNTLEQIPSLYLLTGTSSGAIQKTPTTSFVSTNTSTGTTAVTSGVAATMFTISTVGAYYVFAWVSSSGTNFQSVYLVSSDGVTAHAVAIKAGSSIVISTSGLNVQATVSATGSINYSYLRVA
jgi:hypothetical protein